MKLCKFFKMERTDFFENLLVRFTQPLALNDPYECMPYFSSLDDNDKIKERTSSIMERNKSNFQKKYMNLPKERLTEIQEKATDSLIHDMKNNKNKWFDYHTEVFRKNINDLIGILSLSEKNDSILMWSHYASEHKGFCVEFDGTHPFFTKGNEHDSLIDIVKRVTYSKKRIVSELDSLDKNLFFTKSEEWSYEKEWRMLKNIKEASKSLKGEGLDICLFEVPSNAVCSVYFGAHSSKEWKQDTLEKIRDNKSISTIKCYESRLSYRDFSMEFKEIEDC